MVVCFRRMDFTTETRRRRNTKSEARNPKQILNTNIQMTETLKLVPKLRFGNAISRSSASLTAIQFGVGIVYSDFGLEAELREIGFPNRVWEPGDSSVFHPC